MLFEFKNAISEGVLNNYLSRAVTHCSLLDTTEGKTMTFDDDLRMLLNIGAKFIGRAAYAWGSLDDEEHFRICRERAALCHASNPEMILQCCVFECVTQRHCESTPIPEWVFAAFGQPYERRNFSMAAMSFSDGKFKDHWGKDTTVPDIMTTEGQMWLYYRACSYILCGCEAIHFGQVWLIGANDKDWLMWDKIVGMVRAYAKTHARRGYVICDAHCHGLITDGRSILDFNSFPIRLKEVIGEPYKCVCEEGYSDSLFGRSKGGIHPSGWYADPLPFLIEFDNFGATKHLGIPNHDSFYAWGYDDITWFAMQPKPYRDEFLHYINEFINSRYSNGWLQMPSRRCISGYAGTISIEPEYFDESFLRSVSKNERITNITTDGEDGKPSVDRRFYSANTPSAKCPFGYGDEQLIKATWDKLY